MRPINLSPGDIPTTHDAKPETQHERFAQALLKLKRCEYDLRMALEEGSDLTLTTMDLKTILSVFGKASTGAKPDGRFRPPDPASQSPVPGRRAEQSIRDLGPFETTRLLQEQSGSQDVSPRTTQPKYVRQGEARDDSAASAAPRSIQIT